MLDFVQARYQHVLDLEHINFIKTFHTLPRPAQCLFVRMAGRKGVVFDSKVFSYPEIPDIPEQIKLLSVNGFVGSVDEGHYEAFLTRLTKTVLLDFLALNAPHDSYRKSWKKSVLVDAALKFIHYSEDLIDRHYVVQLQQAELDYLLFLYFGKIVPNLQPFTLRDLGLLKTPDFKTDYDARFDTKAQAITAYFYARTIADTKSTDRTVIRNLVGEIPSWPEPECEMSELARDKLLFHIGQTLERSGDRKKAIAVYKNSQSPDCHERLIRLRYSEGHKSWVRRRLEGIIDDPGSDHEYYFARDFYRLKFNKARTGRLTNILQSGELIEIDEHYRHMPEIALKHYFSRNNYESYYSENSMWRMTFGLLFWHELFDKELSTLYSSFDKTPRELTENQLYNRHKTSIELKLSQVQGKDNIFRYLLKIYTQNYGIPNSLFRWNKYELDKIKQLIYASPAESLAAILRLMAQNYRSMKDGFPDLMLVKNDQIRFVEVKSEGDVIRRNQLTRILQLREAGYTSDIARIKWRLDPDQVYVVVDVETTGGQRGFHRITEIGAVKLKGGEVIDEWQTLINPERHIPKHIQTLTGISNDMVAGAPVFADIAEEFANFFGDHIFAAHNVNFDFGFISREYARLDQKFIAPKICTCSSMRKYFPGRKSYSLKNLCREFDIDLTSHHRALCDARAAAELLKLVNEKRLAAQTEHETRSSHEKIMPEPEADHKPVLSA